MKNEDIRLVKEKPHSNIYKNNVLALQNSSFSTKFRLSVLTRCMY